MTRLTIEFFHDVICSFCFPMSYRMRQIKDVLPEVTIIHRSFALAPDEKSLASMFGSREEAKAEILDHWYYANQNDDLHRFDIAGMQAEDFLFPTSMPGLRAAKAAGLLGGEVLYWDVFDALQKELFTEHKNIDDEAVVRRLVETVLKEKIEDWDLLYHSKELDAALQEDFEKVQSYGIHSVPCLIIEGKYKLSGAQPYEMILANLKRILAEKKKAENDPMIILESNVEPSCSFINGKWICD